MTSAREAFQSRYASHPTHEYPWNSIMEGLMKHRSIRSYAQRTVEPGILNMLIAAAQSAASSSNLQAWSVVAIEDHERKGRLAQMTGGQKHVAECPLFLVWLADLARLDAISLAQGKEAKALDYTELFVLAVIDAALAAQNAVVAAESFGLGSVYIGGIRNQPHQVAAELDLPERVFPVFGLCLGYPREDDRSAVKPRLPQTAVLHRERYDSTAWKATVPVYDRVMETFYLEQKMKVQGSWSQHSAERIKGPEALSGRDVLRETLNRLGFPLL